MDFSLGIEDGVKRTTSQKKKFETKEMSFLPITTYI